MQLPNWQLQLVKRLLRREERQSFKMADAHQTPTYHCLQEEELTWLNVIVTVVAILSFLGSLVVILSYFLSKENQTVARMILVHISLTNIGQVVSSLVGIADLHYKMWSPWIRVCSYQALSTAYFNISAMLWTAGLAVHLYLLILGKQNNIRHFVKYLSAVCYLLPLLVACWLFFTGRLGYAPQSMPGYCGLVGTKVQYSLDANNSNSLKCHQAHDVMGEVLGYNLWVLLTIVVILLLYVSALCHLKQHVSMLFPAQCRAYD